MSELRPWLKFGPIPGWQHHWDPGRVFGLEDMPGVPHIRPSIRLDVKTGRPATDDPLFELAAVYDEADSAIMVLSYERHRIDSPFEITVWHHKYGSPRGLDNPIETVYFDTFEHALDGFICYCKIDIQHPFDYQADDSAPPPDHSPKPQGYGTWA